ncbi:MAG TPA: phosphoribosylglycinamide formyltransferase [Bacillota bacterium]
MKKKNLKKVAVLVSGGGSNLQALLDATRSGEIPAEITLVISNKPGVYALKRAENSGIPTLVIDHRAFASAEEFSWAILNRLREAGVDLVCLAGFMRILAPCVPEAYPNRILNIHPALLPAFGGKGLYGMRVHQAVLASGVKYSGATVHIVTAEPDHGPIVCQEVVPVRDDDTPQSLAERVLQVEHRIYPEALRLLAEELIEVDGLRTRLKTKCN